MPSAQGRRGAWGARQRSRASVSALRMRASSGALRRATNARRSAARLAPATRTCMARSTSAAARAARHRSASARGAVGGVSTTRLCNEARSGPRRRKLYPTHTKRTFTPSGGSSPEWQPRGTGPPAASAARRSQAVLSSYAMRSGPAGMPPPMRRGTPRLMRVHAHTRRGKRGGGRAARAAPRVATANGGGRRNDCNQKIITSIPSFTPPARAIGRQWKSTACACGARRSSHVHMHARHRPRRPTHTKQPPVRPATMPS